MSVASLKAAANRRIIESGSCVSQACRAASEPHPTKLVVVSEALKAEQERKLALPDEVRVWIDGKAVEPDQARVSVFDRGFLYGDSVFETMRTYSGAPFALDEHLERLAESARRVWIELPAPLEQLEVEVRQAVAESGYANCYVRLMVTRGVGALGLDPGLAVAPMRVILVGPLKPPPAEAYERGIQVISFETARAGDATEAAGAKIGNYLVAVLANRKAAEAGAKEALICHADGRVVEGATSNVFWVQDGRLLTPGLDAGILDGITRRYILKVAEARGMEVVFRVPTVEELGSADEVFVSSSIRELVPVVAVDEMQVGDGKPGATTLGLLQAFRAACAERARASVGP